MPEGKMIVDEDLIVTETEWGYWQEQLADYLAEYGTSERKKIELEYFLRNGREKR